MDRLHMYENEKNNLDRQKTFVTKMLKGKINFLELD